MQAVVLGRRNRSLDFAAVDVAVANFIENTIDDFLAAPTGVVDIAKEIKCLRSGFGKHKYGVDKLVIVEGW